jgi:hypothetical protein
MVAPLICLMLSTSTLYNICTKIGIDVYSSTNTNYKWNKHLELKYIHLPFQRNSKFAENRIYDAF